MGSVSAEPVDPVDPGGAGTSDPVRDGDDPAGPPARGLDARRRYGLLFVAATVIVAADQLTKWWALSALDDGHDIDLFWTLRLHLVFNRGSAFSTGEGFGPLIGVLALVIVVALAVFVRRVDDARVVTVLGVIGGGALGNLIDRIFRNGDGFLGGAVVDFVDLQWWPVFNLADAAIVVGGAALVLVGNRLGARVHDTPAHDVPALDE